MFSYKERIKEVCILIMSCVDKTLIPPVFYKRNSFFALFFLKPPPPILPGILQSHLLD